MGQDIKTGEPKVKERAALLHRLFERAWHETSGTHKSQLDLSDIQAQAGPNRGNRRVFLLGFWHDKEG